MKYKVAYKADNLPDGEEVQVNDIGSFKNKRVSEVELTKEQADLLRDTPGFEVKAVREGGEDK